jgi:hypothetical protein
MNGAEAALEVFFYTCQVTDDSSLQIWEEGDFFTSLLGCTSSTPQGEHDGKETLAARFCMKGLSPNLVYHCGGLIVLLATW